MVRVLYIDNINGLHFDTKNILYAYSIAEITLKSYIIIFCCFDDISSSKPQTNDALINHKQEWAYSYCTPTYVDN